MKLGAYAREVQDRELARNASTRHARARVRLLASLDHRPRWRYHILSLAAFTLLTATLVVLGVGAPKRLTFEVGTQHAAGLVGAQLVAPQRPEYRLRFSDGSLVELRPGTHATVTELHSSSAEITVDQGELDVNLRRSPTRWGFYGGPYRVAAAAAHFRMAWNPTTRVFELEVYEGHVSLQGPGGKRSEVGIGQEVRLSSQVREPVRVEVDADVSLGDSGSAQDHADLVPEGGQKPIAARPSLRPMPGVSPPAHAPRKRPQTERWRALADRGDYGAALRAAVALGYPGLCQRLDAPALMRLAEVARFARQGGRATTALMVLRERFPETTYAARAAFELGRIALEGSHNYNVAAKWFVIYLREQPDGAMVSAALGRLITAQAKAGRTDQAQHSAIRYLRRFGTGSHADVARRVLAEAG